MTISERRPCWQCAKPKLRNSYLPSKWNEEIRVCALCRLDGYAEPVTVRHVKPADPATLHNKHDCPSPGECEWHRDWHRTQVLA